MATDLERVGGEAGVRAILGQLLAWMKDDFIVGYLFLGVDLERVLDREVDHAVALLGGPRRPAQRSLVEVHRAKRINRGHFARRLAFLQRAFERFQVPPDIQQRWLAADRRLEVAITDSLDCGPTS
jgi:truncated hemoglobin YjbI